MSADVGDALLGFCLGTGLGLRGKREDSCLLPFIEPRQQHDLAIGELERVMIDVKRALVDLAKDRNGVAGNGMARPCSCPARPRVLRGIEKHKEPIPCHTNPHHPPSARSASTSARIASILSASISAGRSFCNRRSRALSSNAV